MLRAAASVGGGSVFGAQRALGIGRGILINGLGDSITSRPIYQSSPTTGQNQIPAWLPDTTYAVNNLVKNAGYTYVCTTAGQSASSGGPTTFGTGIVDNVARWTHVNARSVRYDTSFLVRMQSHSCGMFRFDMTTGYDGVQSSLIKVYVTNGGSGYVAPTVTFNNGASGTVQTSNGVVTGVTITNSGFANTSATFTGTINDASGTGAVISLAAFPSGTFGVLGSTTADMVARLVDCVNSRAELFTVLGGTNDLAASETYENMTSRLRTCYETLVAAGKVVIPITILPRTGLTTAQNITLMRVNDWIRRYCAKDAVANPNQVSVYLSDPSTYLTDSSSLTNQPIGGAGGVTGAMTTDGVHPSPLGAYYIAMCTLNAAQRAYGIIPTATSRSATPANGYDGTRNPSGNLLDGLPWVASTSYSLGQRVTNDTGKLYEADTAGISASSGGPTGTSQNITDGTARWDYQSGAGVSTFSSGTAAVPTIGSVVGSGNLALGYTLTGSGSATGTIVGAIENPWTDGHIGNRQSLVFSLGSGSANEQFTLTLLNGALPRWGMSSADLGVTTMWAECELEITGATNLTQVTLIGPQSATQQFFNSDGFVASTLTAGLDYSGAMITAPNGGKILRQTQPIVLPSNLTAITIQLIFGFEGSGGAASAGATVKLNYFGVRKGVTS